MQTKILPAVPIEVWDEMKSKHLSGVGIRSLARIYKISEGTVLSYAFRHRWSDEARLYKKVCKEHNCRYRECPPKCMNSFLWRTRIDAAKIRRIRKSHARQVKLRKIQRLLQKPPPKVKLCVFCQEILPSYKMKFCTVTCQSGHNLANKAPPKPKELWARKGPPKKPNPPRKCAQCECQFITERPSSKIRFCSRGCSHASRRRIKPPPVEGNCATCATHIVFPKIKFCSRKCAKRHEKMMDKKLGRKRKKGKPKPRKVNHIRPCAICDKEFQPKSFKHLFCSHKCGLKSSRKRQRIKDKGKVRKPHQRIKRNLSGRLRELLRRKGQQKQNAISSYMGCSPKEMSDHVENQLKGTAMNWENYGVHGWHLDHIIPCSRFDLTRDDHCKVCFNWRNIRPLWGEKNYMRQDMLTLEEALDLDPELVRMAIDVGVKLWQ